MPFSPVCACCRKDIDDMTSVQVCEDCASKLEESASSAPTNTGSPKLPTLEECTKEAQMFAIYDLTYREYGVVRTVYDYICRQLRAGA